MLNIFCKFTDFLRDMEGNQKEMIILYFFCQIFMDYPISFAIFGESITTTMSNKRVLKKNINIVFDALLSECVAMSLYGNKPNKENFESLLATLLEAQKNFISRISHPEPGMKKKEYFNVLFKDFEEYANEAIDQIINLES